MLDSGASPILTPNEQGLGCKVSGGWAKATKAMASPLGSKNRSMLLVLRCGVSWPLARTSGLELGLSS